MSDTSFLVRRFLKAGLIPLILVMASSVLLSCAQRQEVKLPALKEASSGVHQPGKFVWFELITHDLEKVGTFYGDLFGWTFRPYAENSEYFVIELGGSEVAGASR